ncbi:MAG: Brp/Blh family beta-carotene 15,15'-dioxygenase, partial [Planctomycetota bacterium]
MTATWLAVGVGGSLAGVVGIDTWVGPWVWVVSGLVLGLAHGACDAMDAPPGRGRRAMWWLAYGVAIVGFVALVMWWPRGALVGFLLLTAWHFGASDRHDLARLTRSGADVLPIGWRWAAGFGRMGLFFGSMGVAQPAEVARVG